MATRGRPFETGNKFGRGRPRGSRNKTTKVAQELLNSHAEPIVRKALLMALQGEPPILRAVLDRILPVRRETPVQLGPLPMATIADLFKASETVLKKVASGRLTITEAQGVAGLIEGRRKVIETDDIDKRLRAVEEKQP
jgi:hypothetical protein